MNIPRLTLPDLLDFDPQSPVTSPRRRFLCPFPPCQGKTSRTFDCDVTQGVYVCHRCDARGKLGHETGQDFARQPRVNPAQQRVQERADALEKLSVVWHESLIEPVQDTPAMRYLTKRGIPPNLARACGLQFAKRWYGRPAVLFAARDERDTMIAAQGRYIDGRDNPKARTAGKKKLGVFSTPCAWENIITICEAPLDALSLHLMGFPAVAVMGKQLPPMLIPLCQGRIVCLASDADLEGDKSATEWAAQLKGAARMTRLRPPHCKDWNAEICLTGNVL